MLREKRTQRKWLDGELVIGGKQKKEGVDVAWTVKVAD